ncbi:MAG: peptidoglycan editing factor PgeF [Nitrospinota bacterium]
MYNKKVNKNNCFTKLNQHKVDIYLFTIFADLPVKAFFSGRNGGLSNRPFNSLNTDNSNMENQQTVEQNMALIRGALEIKEIFFVKQRHTAKIINLNDNPNSSGQLEGDAIVVDEANRPIAVKTADCLPIILYDISNRVAAAIHAGRAGTEKKILSKVLTYLKKRYNTDMADIIVAFAPAIRQCCYEVDLQSATQFKNSCGEEFVNDRMVDMIGANRSQAVELGVSNSNIYDSQICSACNNQLFFSYRKDNKITGRFLTGITLL